MLKQIKLTRFRKHEDRTFVFSEGLHVFRGANEAGKSTCIEAIAYALFGSKVLRDAFENVVTWGAKPSELKVELDLEMSGVTYTFSRSKGGAEVRQGANVIVTGQNECSAYAEQLLGADAALAANLMLANQGGLRGVLEGGPKATATLIEDLAGFDLLDRILDAAATKLTLGSSASYEARIETLRTYLGNLPATERPDEVAHNADIAARQAERAAVKGQHEVAAEARDRLAHTVATESENRRRAAAAAAELDRCTNQLTQTQAELDSIGTPQPAEDTSALEQRIADLGQARARREAYEKFMALPDTEREDRAVFDAQLKRAIADAAEAKEKGLDAKSMIQIAEAQLISSSVCGLCGQDVSQFPAAREKNEALAAEIEKQKQIAIDAAEAAQIAAAVHGNLKAWMDWEDDLIRAARPITQFLDCDESVMPCRYTWRGEVPAPVTESEPELRAKLAEIRAENDAKSRVRGRIDTLSAIVARLKVERTAAREVWAGISAVGDDELNELSRQFTALHEQVDGLNRRLIEIDSAIELRVREHRQRVEEWQRVEEQRTRLAAEIDAALAEVKTLEFNNALVRKVRAARPIITNKLWGLVLSSVSTIFSMMRGETSIVTRGKNGFEVNGHAVTSLSGSTLDLLGLAVRSALIKTFVPNCPFIVLDEPAAACDSDREGGMLGYVAASGFRQCLLVTHSDTADSFAAKVIRL